ncbi:MAG TPA: type II toxin-antitoxin system PemK/MazF family toxin [Candidatus Angelobacter sp.]|nr:type II toxin-antitoxin system PemK/MazF family toxin [Candidatus Angelobacter sp.]
MKIVHRGIYRLKDDLIAFPDATEPTNRKKHDFRTVLVLSNERVCNSLTCPCVTVVPMSHNTDINAETDIVVKSNSVNKLDSSSRLLFGYMQPVLKSDLEKQIGLMDDEQWERVMEQVVWNFDGS